MTDDQIRDAIVRGLAQYPEVQRDLIALNVLRSWVSPPADTVDEDALAALKPRVEATIDALVSAGTVVVDARGMARAA